MTERKAVEEALKRRSGMSPERREALREFNRSQEYRGVCRVCKVPWTGTLGELPRHCLNCGAPHGS